MKGFDTGLIALIFFISSVANAIDDNGNRYDFEEDEIDQITSHDKSVNDAFLDNRIKEANRSIKIIKSQKIALAHALKARNKELRLMQKKIDAAVAAKSAEQAVSSESDLTEESAVEEAAAKTTSRADILQADYKALEEKYSTQVDKVKLGMTTALTDLIEKFTYVTAQIRAANKHCEISHPEVINKFTLLKIEIWGREDIEFEVGEEYDFAYERALKKWQRGFICGRQPARNSLVAQSMSTIKREFNVIKKLMAL